MRTVLKVLIPAAAIAALSGCVVAPYGYRYHPAYYYGPRVVVRPAYVPPPVVVVRP